MPVYRTHGFISVQAFFERLNGSKSCSFIKRKFWILIEQFYDGFYPLERSYKWEKCISKL